VVFLILMGCFSFLTGGEVNTGSKIEPKTTLITEIDDNRNFSAWFTRAQEDLKAASILIQHTLYSTALFHCHQAVEKALKAYLTNQKQYVPKIHSLEELIELCVQLDLHNKFQNIKEAVLFLDPFCTQFRYPHKTDIEFPTKDLAEKAYSQAKLIIRLVRFAQ